MRQADVNLLEANLAVLGFERDTYSWKLRTGKSWYKQVRVYILGPYTDVAGFDDGSYAVLVRIFGLTHNADRDINYTKVDKCIAGITDFLARRERDD